MIVLQPVFLLYQKGRSSSIKHLPSCLMPLQNLNFATAVVIFLLIRARVTQHIYGDVGVSPREELVWRTYYRNLNNLNIIGYSQSWDYYPVEKCGRHFPTLGLPVALSLGKKLRSCWVYYRVMTTVLIFFRYIPLLHFFSILKFCCKWFILPDDKLWQFHQSASVMSKQEKTRDAMFRNNRDNLPNLTFIFTISVFWGVHLEPIGICIMELFGKIAASWLLFLQ